MGCWNETCILTNLPILEGEPCYGIVLHTRTEADWQVESPIATGKYNECGGLKAIQPSPAWDKWKTLVRADIRNKTLSPRHEFAKINRGDWGIPQSLQSDYHEKEKGRYETVLLLKQPADAILEAQPPDPIREDTFAMLFQVAELGTPRFLKTAIEFPKEAKKIRAICTILCRLRRDLAPLIGGQYIGVENYKKLAQFTNRYIKKLEKIEE